MSGWLRKQIRENKLAENATLKARVAVAIEDAKRMGELEAENGRIGGANERLNGNKHSRRCAPRCPRGLSLSPT